MPMLDIQGQSYYFEDAGHPDLPTVVCLHSLSFDHRMFEEQAAALIGKYRVVRPDFRGQGRSARTKEHAITMDSLAEDIVELCKKLGVSSAHFVAQSMGADVALRVAAKHPALVKSLVLMGASACAEPPANLRKFRLMTRIVSLVGARIILKPTMQIMFGASFRADPARQQVLNTWRERIACADRSLHRAIRGVVERESVEHLLPSIKSPALVISGTEDEPRPPAWSQALAQGLPNSRLQSFENVGHSPTIEAPERVNHALLKFIAEVEAAALHSTTTQ